MLLLLLVLLLLFIIIIIIVIIIINVRKHSLTYSDYIFKTFFL